MPKPPLSMKPTGWFQVAWSDEIDVGDVHRMTYFGEEMIAWRAESGPLTVMNAFCEHLGAHLGFGGQVVGEVLQCGFHGWQWSQEGRNVCIPYQNRPNRGRRIRTYPVVERNESVYVWHDVRGREPYFDVPDLFADFNDGSNPDEFHRPRRLYCERLEIHPQYVQENGVDFAHFRYVHGTPEAVFTRHDFAEPVSFVDFKLAFAFGAPSDEAQTDVVESCVEAINGGLGVTVTRSYGLLAGRTVQGVTPVDDYTSDVRFTAYIGKDDAAYSEADAQVFSQEVIKQFEQDIVIWQHQRYSDPPALATAEYAGFTAIRQWAKQFYPDGIGGSAAEVYAASQAASGTR
ncbi:Rieske 2Fe-2S domain-containing protein [Mycobacterium sp. E796]|uniref:Rieske 2Fe-2S domain-containing protein n=1 Tax=Mycobacterium sp. E796 TaxID=1834151 RepID=UPI0007FC2F9E|nr:Rieske 2Fe-2S domain-containing protein [Mycobacterium sp. E796]OBI44018.1 2Fe-2S ferredoxin [Mycobacterium sp. E796]